MGVNSDVRTKVVELSSDEKSADVEVKSGDRFSMVEWLKNQQHENTFLFITLIFWGENMKLLFHPDTN